MTAAVLGIVVGVVGMVGVVGVVGVMVWAVVAYRPHVRRVNRGVRLTWVTYGYDSFPRPVHRRLTLRSLPPQLRGQWTMDARDRPVRAVRWVFVGHPSPWVVWVVSAVGLRDAWRHATDYAEESRRTVDTMDVDRMVVNLYDTPTHAPVRRSTYRGNGA